MILINRSGTNLRPSEPISPGSSIEAVYLSLLRNSTHFATSVAKWVKLLQLYYLHPLECFPFGPTSTHKKVPAADLRQSLQLCSDFTHHCCSARFSLLQRRQHVVQPFFSAYSATPRVSDGELRPQLLRPCSWRAENPVDVKKKRQKRPVQNDAGKFVNNIGKNDADVRGLTPPLEQFDHETTTCPITHTLIKDPVTAIAIATATATAHAASAP